LATTHKLLALLTVFIWGSNFVVIKTGLEHWPPFLFTGLRFLFAAIPLIFFLPRPNTSWTKIILYGLFIGVGQFGLLFWAMDSNISPGLASLVVQIQVFFTIIVSIFVFSEQVKIFQYWALMISFVGIFVIGYYSDADATILGIVLVLLAALAWAFGNIVIKSIGKINIIGFLSWSSLFAVPPLLLISYFKETPEVMVAALSAASLSAWFAVLWQTIGNTLIGYGIWNYLLNQYPAAILTPWALLVPVFGMSASSLMLAESLPLWKIIAAALVLSGLLINLYYSKKKIVKAKLNLLNRTII
jgi:O-acetylserine/cysteine efflux transporter